jgi:hypothetical protein
MVLQERPDEAAHLKRNDKVFGTGTIERLACRGADGENSADTKLLRKVKSIATPLWIRFTAFLTWVVGIRAASAVAAQTEDAASLKVLTAFARNAPAGLASLSFGGSV